MRHFFSAVVQGLFGNTAASQTTGLFGAAQTSTATGFGTGTGLFGQPNTGFGTVGTQVQVSCGPLVSSILAKVDVSTGSQSTSFVIA